MKKVKTILTILVLMLTSVWASACSCGGEPEVEQVNPTAIKIELVSEEGSSITSRIDQATEFLVLDGGRVEDTFVLRYTITPANVTATEVFWECESFENNGEVKPYGLEKNSRSDSAIEEVKFQITKRPTDKETCKAKITFRTAVHGKEAVCIVNIGPKLDDVSRFVAPSGLNYNPTTNSLSWNPVTQVYNNSEMLVNATLKADGTAVGLENYELVSTDKDGNETVITLPATQTSYSGPEGNGLEAGIEHNYKVRAIANEFLANSSEFSSNYKFHELLPTGRPANNNGTISFTIPEFGKEVEVYAYANNNIPSCSITSTAGEDVDLSYKEFKDYSSNYLYSIRTIAYPCSVTQYKAAATTGYVIGDVFYFASDASKTLEVQRLQAPKLKLISTTTDLMVNNITFNEVTGGTVINIEPGKEGGYEAKFGVKYDYKIESPNDTSIGTGVTTSFPLNQAEWGSNQVTVTVKGNPDNTICEPQEITSKVTFNVFKHENLYTIDKDILTISGGDGLSYSGVEFYFISQDANFSTARTESKYFVVKAADTMSPCSQTQFDLSQFDITEGSYKLFVNRIPLINDTTRNAMAIPNTDYSVGVTKSKSPANATISADGYLTFTSVATGTTGHSDYEVMLGIDDIYTSPVIINSQNIKLEDIYNQYLEELKEKNLEQFNKQPQNLDLWFTSDKTLTCKIRTVGLWEETRFASISSEYKSISLTREASVSLDGKQIDLKDYYLSFACAKNSNSKYRVDLKLGDKTVSAEISDTDFEKFSNNDTIGEIHLENIKFMSNTTEMSFAKFIEENVGEGVANVQISITKLGSIANNDQLGSMNSTVASKSFGVTNQVVNVSLDDDNVLSWQTPVNSSNVASYKYTITLIDAEASTETNKVVLDTINVSASDCTPTTIEGGAGTQLTYNIETYINNNIGKLIEIIIVEGKSDYVNNKASESYYITKLETPTSITPYVFDGNYYYGWDPINRAGSYAIDVYGRETPLAFRNATIVKNDKILFPINDSTCLDIGYGTFNIQVTATKQSGGSDENSKETPFIIASDVNSDTILHLVSSAIIVSANNNSIEWENPLANLELNPTYDIYYPANGSTDEFTPVEILPEEELQTTVSYDTSSANLAAGQYDIKVVPSIDFTTTNVIFVGTASTKTITKLGEAVNFRTFKGAFLFDILGEQGAYNNVSIELYNNGELVPDSQYSWSKVGNEQESTPTTPGEGEGEETISSESTSGKSATFTVVLEGMDSGKLSLQVKYKANTFLSSNLNTTPYTGTKIDTVTGFKLNGQSGYIEWDADDTFAITQYKIIYWQQPEEGDPEYNNRVLKVSKGTETTSGDTIYEAWFGEGETQVANGEIFKYQKAENKFYYVFDETKFFNASGDTNFKIQALTSTDGYFNSSVSSEVTITKINSGNITVDGGVVNIDDYVSNGSKEPVSYTIKISKLTGETDAEDKPIVASSIIGGTTYYHVYEKTETVLSDIPTIDLNVIGYQLPEGIKFADDSTFVPFSSAGDYLIELTFNKETNADNVLSSDTISVEKSKLPTTASIGTNNGEVVWTEVSGADTYTLEVVESDQTTHYFTFDGKLNGVSSKTKIDDGVALKYDPVPEEELPENPAPASLTREGEATEFMFEEGSTYTLRIRANADDAIYSLWSKPFTIEKLVAPTNLYISANTVIDLPVKVEITTENEGGSETTETTQKLTIGTPLVTWNNVNTSSRQPSGYAITYSTKALDIYGLPVISQAQYSENIPYSTFTEPDSSDAYNGRHYYPINSNKEVAKYYIQMKAFGNTTTNMEDIGYINSNLSLSTDNAIANLVADVSNVAIKNGQVSWGKVEGAYSYTIKASKSTGTHLFSTEVSDAGVAISALDMAGTLAGGQGYTFEVNAKTQPNIAIVSTHDTALPTTNVTSVFRPATVTDVAVRNGELSWRISISDIEEFIETVGIKNIEFVNSGLDTTNKSTLAQSIARYVENSLAGTVVLDSTLDAIISQLIFVKLNINGTVIDTIPTSAKYNQTGGYIEYYYHFGIRQDNPTETYKPGVYDINIALPGNSVSSAAVIDSYYTTKFTAHKPNTPRTWTKDGADIYQGRVQWELTTTAESTIQEYKYFDNYEIVATPVVNDVASGVKEVVIPVAASVVEENIKDYYKYYRNLKDDLFVINQAKEKNNLIADTFYNLKIRVVGTTNGSGEGVHYFNSDYASFNNQANILDPSKKIHVASSMLDWEESYGSTATRLYIYGPFDNVVRDGNNVITTIDFDNSDWYKESGDNSVKSIIELLDKVRLEGEKSLTETEKTAYNSVKDKIRIVELGSENERKTEYTLTNTITIDEILGERGFEPGAYVIKHQEIGDGKGVVDSYLTEGIFAHKLGTSIYHQPDINEWKVTDIQQQYGWVGIYNYSNTTSTVYEWESDDTWGVKTLNGNQTAGVFVWDPVAGANAYKVTVWKQPISGGQLTELETAYIRETRFAIPDTGDAYNDDTAQYGITIVPIRTMSDSNFEGVVDDVFTADTIETTYHERVATPQDPAVNVNNGIIDWNPISEETKYQDYIKYYNYINATTQSPVRGNFRIMVNDNREGTADVESNYVNVAIFGANGPIRINIKTLAPSGVQNVISSVGSTNVESKVFLNGSYCKTFEIERLANPVLRLIDGVLYWGTEGDPVTTSTLKINGTAVEGIDYNTIYSYFTEIMNHDPYYAPDNYTTEGGTDIKGDHDKFPLGTHLFEVKFDGTEGLIGDEVSLVTSDFVPVTVTKLPAPVLTNKLYNDGGVTKNMVSWAIIENAEGYQIKVFAEKLGAVETIEDTDLGEGSEDGSENEDSTSQLEFRTIRIHKDAIASDPRFVVKDGEIYFDVAELIEALGLQSGGNMYVYIQAIGSGFVTDEDAPESSAVKPQMSEGVQTNLLYISSSYSRFSTIGVPASATGITFGADGILSWNTESQYGYDVRIVSNYNIKGLTAEELEYWKNSSDKYTLNGGNTNVQNDESVPEYAARLKQYPEILYRQVDCEKVDETYNIFVTETIKLVKADDGTTPTSYTVSAVATYTSFSIVLMAFDDADAFASSETQWLGSKTFSQFKSGDGTTANPYIVNGSTHLNNIRNYSTRHFKIVNDIVIPKTNVSEEKWYAINSLSGSIDGSNDQGNFTITIEDGAMEFLRVNGENRMALINSIEVGGEVRNLNVNVNLSYEGGLGAIRVAGVAIYNYGDIRNVSVTGDLNVQTTSTSNTPAIAGGIVAMNLLTYDEDDSTQVKRQGVIENCHYIGNIVVLDNSSQASSVGGIAQLNSGKIINSSYTGTADNTSMILSNIVGGIAAQNLLGTISNCYVNEYVEIKVTDIKTNGYGLSSGLTAQHYKSLGIQAGGIVGSVLNNEEVSGVTTYITNCYSKANLVIAQYCSDNRGIYSVGGLAGTIQQSIILANINNNFVLVNITREISNNGNWYALSNKQLGDTNKFAIKATPDGTQPSGGITITELNAAILALKVGEEYIYELVNVEGNVIAAPTESDLQNTSNTIRHKSK